MTTVHEFRRSGMIPAVSQAMPRQKAVYQSEFPYSISARCINREWFNIPMEEVWKIMSEELFLTHRFFDFQIHAFVLLSNHFHLLATTPAANVSEGMCYFMKRTSNRLTEAGNRTNQTYGGRHYKCILNSHRYFLNTYKYVYRNPVDAGICENAAVYPYSTLSGLLGRASMIIPVVEDPLLFSNPIETVSWINERPSPEKLHAMKQGLKRQYFASPKSRSNGRPVLAENDVL